jgi:branched-chain amino acid aminotransferase
MQVNEKRLTIDEVYAAHKNRKAGGGFCHWHSSGHLPVGELCWKDQVITVNDSKIGSVSQKLYDTLTGIQTGKIEDQFGWTTEV